MRKTISHLDVELLIKEYCHYITFREQLLPQSAWSIIDAYCGRKPRHDDLLPYIAPRLYQTPLTIDVTRNPASLMLYTDSGPVPIHGISTVGAARLQEQLRNFRKKGEAENRRYEEAENRRYKKMLKFCRTVVVG